MTEITATRWPLDLMWRVSRLYVDMNVDWSYEQHAGFGGELHSEAAERLRREAHALVVELDIHDTTWLKVGEDFKGLVYRCSWWPSIKTVELVGGASDGRVVDVGVGGEPWRIVNPHRPVMLEPESYGPTVLESYDTLYRVAGWNETERRWLYSPS